MRIRNWKRHQHFSNRRPPWIKLYRDLLDDHDWHRLDPEAAKTLVMLWLIASEGEAGELPAVETIAFRLRTTEKKINDTLSRLSKWIERRDINAISAGYQSDPLETEIEREKETEKETALATALAVASSSFPPECFAIAERLRAGILKNNPTAKVPPNLEPWAKCADLMLRLDKRTPQQVELVIDFSQYDSFWKQNVLSMDAVRRQFDRLVLKMKSAGPWAKEDEDRAELKRQEELRERANRVLG